MEPFAYAVSLLLKYKYAALFPMLMANTIVVAFSAAFLASPAGGGIFNVWIVLALVIFTDSFTDSMYYLIGRWGKGWLVKRYPNPFSISPDRFVTIEEYFSKEGWKTLVLAKLSHAIGMPTMVVAGSARFPYVMFFAVTVPVSIFKSSLFVALGYFYGHSYKEIAEQLGMAGAAFTLLFLTAIIYFVYRFRKGRKKSYSSEEDGLPSAS